MNITHAILDIEGTTTPVDFVHRVLFPYSSENMAAYLVANARDLSSEFAAVNKTQEEEKSPLAQTIEEYATTLCEWIARDRKHPALKSIQGHIWDAGYKVGAFKSPLYDDVVPAIRRWRAAGIKVGIYSSGSVKAQKLLFSHTDYGDITGLFDFFFDTAVGSKREASSYRNILEQLRCPGVSACFLSDIVEELAAAASCGIKPWHVVRPGTTSGNQFPVLASFSDLPLS